MRTGGREDYLWKDIVHGNFWICLETDASWCWKFLRSLCVRLWLCHSVAWIMCWGTSFPTDGECRVFGSGVSGSRDSVESVSRTEVLQSRVVLVTNEKIF